MYVRMHVSMYVRMYACMYVCMYVIQVRAISDYSALAVGDHYGTECQKLSLVQTPLVLLLAYHFRQVGSFLHNSVYKNC